MNLKTIKRTSLQSIYNHLGYNKSMNGFNADVSKLFRGQSQDYRNLKPTLARLDQDDIDFAQDINSNIDQIMTHFDGEPNMSVPLFDIDQVGILQHFSWPTALLDWTASLEVASYFALSDANQEQECVIYELDLNILNDDCYRSTNNKTWVSPDCNTPLIIHELDFLKSFDMEALFKRWWCQDGYVIAPSNFTSKDLKDWDLLANTDIQKAITVHHFLPQKSDINLFDVRRLYDLKRTRGGKDIYDDTPNQIKDALMTIPDKLGKSIPDHFQNIINNLFTVREATYIDGM